MSRWYVANGGALAIVLAGLGIAGWTSGLVGFSLVGAGAVLFLVSLTRKPSLADPEAPAPREPAADIQVIGNITPTGGGDGHVAFRVEVANYGDRQIRSMFSARVGDTRVECDPPFLDLIPGQPPQSVRIVVPRPGLGNRIQAFGNENEQTLYGRTLTFEASAADEAAVKTWSEHVYTPEENRVRYEIQQREFRFASGEETEADRRAEHLQEIINREKSQDVYDDV